jgi:arylsulfatase A-like enzyme
MFDNTMIMWMGEFGRTPQINPRGGRDHYPKAFNAVVAGGGIRGGQVIGETDAAGIEVVSRPVGIHDLFQTVCKSMKIDPAKENMSPIGRPIKIVDGGKPIQELIG